MTRELFCAASQRTITIHLPDDAGFTTILKGGAPTRHAHASHVEAIAAYLAHVEALLADGFLELGPWLTLTDGDQKLEVRPPAVPQLQTRTDQGEVETRAYDTLPEAMAAFNALIAEKIAQGWRFVMPDWIVFEPLEGFDLCEEDENAETIRRY